MRILLSNDDGINAPGLKMLYDILVELGHEVYVVAPELQHSGTSHKITLNEPLILRDVFHEGKLYGTAVNGSPADAVKLGLANLHPDADLVLSGINLGNNAGPAIYYSGTVAAAFEGAIIGKTAIAVSLNSFKESAFEGLKELIQPFFPLILSECTEKLLYNINLPKTSSIKGVEVTRQYQVFFMDQYEKRLDPRGREYFWLKNVSYSQEAPHHDTGEYLNDLDAVRDGYISITPLQFNLTGFQHLEQLKGKIQAAMQRTPFRSQ